MDQGSSNRKFSNFSIDYLLSPKNFFGLSPDRSNQSPSQFPMSSGMTDGFEGQSASSASSTYSSFESPHTPLSNVSDTLFSHSASTSTIATPLAAEAAPVVAMDLTSKNESKKFSVYDLHEDDATYFPSKSFNVQDYTPRPNHVLNRATVVESLHSLQHPPQLPSDKQRVSLESDAIGKCQSYFVEKTLPSSDSSPETSEACRSQSLSDFNWSKDIDGDTQAAGTLMNFNWKKPKQKRTFFTKEQVRELERAFHENKLPTTKEKREIAKTLKVGEVPVYFWFQNRRNRRKNIKAAESSSKTSEASASQSSSDCNISKDINGITRAVKGAAEAAANSGLRKPDRRPVFLTSKQLVELEQVFQEKIFVTTMETSEIARRLQLSEMKVFRWFQARRAKWKLEGARGINQLKQVLRRRRR